MTVKFLDWDSGFFNKKIGLLHYDKSQSVLSSDIGSFDLVYAQSPQNFDLKLKDFSTAYSETKVIYIKEIYSVGVENDLIKSIDTSNIHNNLDVLYKLAFESGKHSRFKLDTNFSNNDFEKLYKTWIDNSLNRKIADDVLAYYEENKLIGFVSYKIENKKATIGLIAIDNNHQGKGIGKQLLKEVERRLFSLNVLELLIPTQTHNHQACNFYEKCGYIIDKKITLKHYWRNDNTI